MNVPACSASLDVWAEDKYMRVKAGLTSMLLALKKRPLIRYQKSSNMCKRLASDLAVCVVPGA